MTVLTTSGEEETRSAGRAFARQLAPGAVVALTGDLGSGKTRFVQGVCGGLGVEGHVASPTFTLVHEYAGANGTPVYHFDFYRIRSLEEVVELGFEEYLRPDAICLIEWAEKVLPLLPEERFDVQLRLGAEEQLRELTITARGRAAA